ncbi:GNAT family N-acetyltransferase [Cognatiyoonia sp. IB215446]|uniref:GNAT family N-acetyltransferase n=1 Tax=Cognatiyoonia sp. IB215446 TaxID=3097355 RepID=UPI002A17E678|nr:GNAT family N-acetyltransferase [Cognatiyoonia sp. IB215446]MDX8350078.1 GNAT family N-acetyltransferase [Cognatiyoonia sp. IB215446]
MMLATEADRPVIEAFLTKHVAASMFPLSNLRRHGMAGGHPRAMRCWSRWQAGALTDVLSITEEGVVFPQCPTEPWGDIKAVLTGRHVKGILGEGRQVAALHAALGLPSDPALNAEEPHYELPLRDLIMPDVSGFSLRRLSDAPYDLVVGWRRAYLEEVLPMPGEDTQETAIKNIDNYIDVDSHRVLYENDEPVGMTGFNATLPEAVQIGGVYTPPEQRSRGLARRAVALHLEEARSLGVKHAILFSASAQASKAYEAVGFQRIGTFTILMFEEPQVVHG